MNSLWALLCLALVATFGDAKQLASTTLLQDLSKDDDVNHDDVSHKDVISSEDEKWAIPKFRCDYTYFREAEGFLKLHEIPSTWENARFRCMTEGARLASPLNDGLRKAIQQTIDEKKITRSIYTGVHATFTKGLFASLEGVPLDRIPHEWAINEPDNYKDGEDCMVILPDGISWADVPCNETFPYICYKSKYAVGEFNKACGINDPEYTYDSRTGSCYKFHKVPRTWSRAYLSCAAEGGHMAIINSDTEATVIRQIFERNPANSIPGNFDKNEALVGLYNLKKLGKWLTVHDETLEEAGYAKWAPGEPNNANNNEYCGAVTRSATFNDLNCENQRVFICERGPETLKCEDN